VNGLLDLVIFAGPMLAFAVIVAWITVRGRRPDRGRMTRQWWSREMDADEPAELDEAA
jgi:hypothetical protein